MRSILASSVFILLASLADAELPSTPAVGPDGHALESGTGVGKRGSACPIIHTGI